MNTPANGPISEYGRYRTANASTAAAGLGNDLRAEERVGGEPGVEYAVPGLGDQAGGEELAEVPLGKDVLQFGAGTDGPPDRLRSPVAAVTLAQLEATRVGRP